MLIRVINSMKEKEFLQNYFNNFNNLTKFNDETINKLVYVGVYAQIQQFYNF